MQLSLYDESTTSKFVLKTSVKVVEAMIQHFLLYLHRATNTSTIPDSIIHNRVEIFQSLVEMANYN